jgi:hypothetical protein
MRVLPNLDYQYKKIHKDLVKLHYFRNVYFLIQKCEIFIFKMFNNPAQILQAFFSNDNAARSVAEKQLMEFARTSPNDSIDLHISALDLEAQQVSSYFLGIKIHS